MGGPASEPLTPDQAKRQLRASLDALSARGWIRRHPLQTVGLAFISGALWGSNREVRRLALAVLARYLR